MLEIFNGCRFQALRDLMPSQEKMDKASFLMAAVEYIRKLQVGLLLCIRISIATCTAQDQDFLVSGIMHAAKPQH